MADKAQTWVYTEDYVAESDALTAARAVATEMGASPVSAGTGAALRMLAAVSGARAVLEVGTGAGVSGLWLLDGMAADGVLTTIDSESELLGHARRNFAAAGLSSHRTRLIAGRALDVLPRMAARGYDMVVLDGDLEETPQYLDHAVRILRPGGTIAFVHALWRDQVADPARRDAHTVVAREVVNYLRDSDEFVPAAEQEILFRRFISICQMAAPRASASSAASCAFSSMTSRPPPSLGIRMTIPRPSALTSRGPSPVRGFIAAMRVLLLRVMPAPPQAG